MDLDPNRTGLHIPELGCVGCKVDGSRSIVHRWCCWKSLLIDINRPRFHSKVDKNRMKPTSDKLGSSSSGHTSTETAGHKIIGEYLPTYYPFENGVCRSIQPIYGKVYRIYL